MTDKEIIKALENCFDYSPSCEICKYDADTLTSSECMGALMKDSLDLINRKYEEIEKMKNELKITRGYIHENNLEYDLLAYSKKME